MKSQKEMNDDDLVGKKPALPLKKFYTFLLSTQLYQKKGTGSSSSKEQFQFQKLENWVPSYIDLELFFLILLLHIEVIRFFFQLMEYLHRFEKKGDILQFSNDE